MAASDETIRQMMAGFSAMQAQMGLLPIQQAQALAGAPQMQMPPPPPMMHPSEAAMRAMDQHNSMIQQTLQAAQVTRYQPPPSAPMPSVSPYASQVPFANMGAFGGYGGGGAPGGSPFSMGAGGMGAPSYIPRMPSVFNPFAPTLPGAHFASPAMRNLQLMQHSQSQLMGAMSGLGEAGLGMAGSVVGGALGSMLGPLGTMAGSWLGGKLGGAVSSMVFNPVTADFARGRQVETMTAPYMVSGPFMNTATGQGMNAQASRQVATGIRHMARDLDYERTGFNTQDAMRIMQMSADSGLLTGANTPDQLISKVKELSKMVKVITRISGDPDVHDAIASLAQMRNLGFNTLAMQGRAVADRAAYARMAGMSQSQMNATMMVGAEMAGTMGLAGATGASAAMAGAGSANVAASSNALNALQLARAGGVGGLGRTAAQAGMHALDNDLYLIAGSKVGKDGKLQMDMDEYRRVQGLSLRETANLAADKMRDMQAHGIFDWSTRRQEMKDYIAQQLKPGEMQMLALKQAAGFMKMHPSFTLGMALQQTQGLDANQARDLENMYSSRQYYDAMIEQRKVQARDEADERSAERAQYMTPGIGTRIRRGIGGALASASDALSSPFRRISEHLDRVHETDMAQARGELVSHYDEVQLVRTDADRKLMLDTLHSQQYQRLSRQTGGGIGSESTAGRMFNRIGSALGLSAESNDNRLVQIQSESQAGIFDWHPFSSFGDVGEARRGAASRASGARAAGMRVSAGTYGGLYDALEKAGVNTSSGAVVQNVVRDVVTQVRNRSAGVILGASALDPEFIKINAVRTLQSHGLSPDKAEAMWNEHKEEFMAVAFDQIKNSGNQKLIEPIAKMVEQAHKAGGVDFTGSRDRLKESIEGDMISIGFKDADVKDSTVAELKNLFGKTKDKDVVALAAIQAQDMYGGSEGGKQAMAEIQRRRGKDFAGLMDQAAALNKGASAEAKKALATLGTAPDARTLAAKTGVFTSMTGKEMAMATEDQMMKLISSINQNATGDTIDEALGKLSDQDIDNSRMSAGMKATLKKAMRGDQAAKDQLALKVSPTGTEVRTSAESLEVDTDDLEAARAQFAKDEADDKDTSKDQAKVHADAAKTFSDAVLIFKDTVNKLNGGGEQDHLDYSMPPSDQQGGN